MNKNRKLIEEVIRKRNLKSDPVKKFATRNKASPLNSFEEFREFTEEQFEKIYQSKIDGVKLKFRYTILTINGRHNPF